LVENQKVLGRDNSREVGPMFRGIVIRRDGGGDLRLEELAGLRAGHDP
jgi:hypothetical protein